MFGVQASQQASNIKISTERSQKCGQCYWMKTGILTHIQVWISLPYLITSYGYEDSFRSILSYLQPINVMGNLSVAFSKLWNRFSDVTQGIPGIKCRAVQE